MKVFLCRHGETDHNRENIVQGQMDTSLNQRGRRQAEVLAERLEGKSIDCIYSSTMERAEVTAELVSERVGTGFETVEELKEISRAGFEGESFEELVDEIAGSDVEDYLWCPDGGESLEELKERATGFFEKLKHLHPEGRIVVISHGGTISASLMGLLEHSSMNAYRLRQDNCCVNELRWSEGRGWEVVSVNDTCHLD